MVQIIPTVFFFVVYMFFFNNGHISSKNLGPSKEGYWFTLSLFEFFCFYSLTMILNPFKYKKWQEDIFVIFIALLVLGFTVGRFNYFDEGTSMISKFRYYLGIKQTRFYIFFCLGTIIKKYYSLFNSLIDNKYVMALVLLLTLGMLMFSEKLFYTVGFVIYGFLGIIVILTYFRKHEYSITKERPIGRALQFVGRRTLDVYLLHYFFLPRHLSGLGLFFKENPNPAIEFFCTLFISILVITITLIISEVIRLSPFLQHRLFGVKAQEKK